MSFLEILILGIGLSMDAFAIAVCKGLNMKKLNIKNGIIIAIFFGFFQFIMPLIGYFFCSQFEIYIRNFDHWIVFSLLTFIGLKMIIESLKKETKKEKILETEQNQIEKNDNLKKLLNYINKISYKELFILAIATSIDALAVGISLAFFDIEIFSSCGVIGMVTFLLSFAGIVIGNFFGEKFKKPAEITGGIILVLIGVKILLEHLNILCF